MPANEKNDDILLTLAGGPPSLMRVREITGTEPPEKLVVSHGGHNEHFNRTDEMEMIEDRAATVFRWSHRTCIAE